MIEYRLTKRLPLLISSDFNVRRIRTIWTPAIIAPLGDAKDFFDKVEQAVEGGVIDDDDDMWLRVTDLVVRSQRKSDRSTLWFTVEASRVINDDDITHSTQSANAIRKIYGQDALPIVYGYRIHDDQMRLAEELGVQVYLDPDRD